MSKEQQVKDAVFYLIRQQFPGDTITDSYIKLLRVFGTESTINMLLEELRDPAISEQKQTERLGEIKKNYDTIIGPEKPATRTELLAPLDDKMEEALDYAFTKLRVDPKKPALKIDGKKFIGGFIENRLDGKNITADLLALWQWAKGTMYKGLKVRLEALKVSIGDQTAIKGSVITHLQKYADENRNRYKLKLGKDVLPISSDIDAPLEVNADSDSITIADALSNVSGSTIPETGSTYEQSLYEQLLGGATIGISAM